MRLVVPEREEQGALQQKAIGIAGRSNPVQEALQREAVQQQVVVVAAALGQVQQSRQDGGATIRGHATTVSR